MRLTRDPSGPACLCTSDATTVLQHVEQDPCSAAWELYLTGLERFAGLPASSGPRPRVCPPEGTAKAHARALELLDLLAGATADWAREGLCQASGEDASTSNPQPVRWALLHPVLYHVEGLPTIQQLQDKLARLQASRYQSRALRDATVEAQQQLQELRCPPWRAYPCIELTPDVKRWPRAIQRHALTEKHGFKKKGNPQYYYRVTLRGKSAAGHRIKEYAHRLVCWAAHGPPNHRGLRPQHCLRHAHVPQPTLPQCWPPQARHDEGQPGAHSQEGMVSRQGACTRMGAPVERVEDGGCTSR